MGGVEEANEQKQQQQEKAHPVGRPKPNPAAEFEENFLDANTDHGNSGDSLRTKRTPPGTRSSGQTNGERRTEAVMLWIRGQWLLQFAHHTVHSPHNNTRCTSIHYRNSPAPCRPRGKMVSGLRTSSAKGEDNVEKQYEKKTA